MNIAVIGVGALGKRHLQSMLELRDRCSIYAVEVNADAITALQKEYSDVCFTTSMDDLPEELAAAVIATSADVRRQVFEQLCAHSKVRNIVFEKVLFQRVEDYYDVLQQLNERGIHAWVNCARREWDSYKALKAELSDCQEMHFTASGGNWGLGCNAIHMLDLIEFLSDSKVDRLDLELLEKGLAESKRKGFLEFYGTIGGTAGKCKHFAITCMNSALPFRLEITTESARHIIDEGHNQALVSTAETDWNWQEREFRQVYQSQMTGRVVKSIIEDGTCNLTRYDDSMELHLKYIKPLIDFFRQNGLEGDVCPIT